MFLINHFSFSNTQQHMATVAGAWGLDSLPTWHWNPSWVVCSPRSQCSVVWEGKMLQVGAKALDSSSEAGHNNTGDTTRVKAKMADIALSCRAAAASQPNQTTARVLLFYYGTWPNKSVLRKHRQNETRNRKLYSLMLSSSLFLLPQRFCIFFRPFTAVTAVERTRW